MIQGDVINVFDYMTAAQIADVTSNAATIDVAPAVQAAITAATAAKRVLRLPAGTYRLEATLTISGNNWLIGDGKDGTKLDCRHGASCIIASGWGGRIAALSIYTYEVGSHAIQAGNDSRNCCIDAVYLDATAIGATTKAGAVIGRGTSVNTCSSSSLLLTITSTASKNCDGSSSSR